jgi:hypothetical protein
MPLFYKHWSFGKHFAQHEVVYRKGMRGLAYEIVINSNPCISYIMEENTATMQALVIAHAAFGHNHFFKNNYLFRQWTDANGILDYLDFAKAYISGCEERYGQAAVEQLLDAAHALMSHGVHRYPRKKKADLKSEEARERDRHVHQERMYNDRRTLPKKGSAPRARWTNGAAPCGRRENILYFRRSRRRGCILAARGAAHVPDHAIFLSPGPDQGAERGLRHLLPLPDHDQPAASRRDQRRRLPGVPPLAQQRHLPAAVRQPALWRAEPLRGRLRHYEGHRAHLRGADGRGPRWFPDIAGNDDAYGTCATSGAITATRVSSRSSSAPS